MSRPCHSLRLAVGQGRALRCIETFRKLWLHANNKVLPTQTARLAEETILAISVHSLWLPTPWSFLSLGRGLVSPLCSTI